MDNYICEIPSPIPMQKTSSFENKKLGLNHTNNDPTKLSPRNVFMDKLAKRMDTYYSPKNVLARTKKEAQ